MGLALGGGGARGLAHIPVLELLDDLGLRPHCIAGTSIGAVMGALYAAGLSGREIRERLDRLVISERDSWPEVLFRKQVFRWFEFLGTGNGGGLLRTDSFARYLEQALGCNRFEQLATPLKVVASELWSGDQRVLTHGNLSTAVQASMALPGLFSPIRVNGELLVDGGIVNPVPYDLLWDECDAVIAVDVLGDRLPERDGRPSWLDSLFISFQNMQKAVLKQKLQQRPPTLYLRPQIVGVRMLEFYKADEVYRQAKPAVETARSRITGWATGPIA